jgi:hypothetical protein
MKTQRFLRKNLLLAILGCASAGFGQAINLTHPERMVESFGNAVVLSPEQRAKAEQIIRGTVNELLALPDADRLRDPVGIRPRMHAELRAILTPEQRKKYDRTPQIDGGGLTLQTPENKAGRLDALVKLTPRQMTQTRAIFSDELDALLALLEADRLRGGAPIRQETRAKIRAILTPEQQGIYDVASQGLGGGSTKPGGG